MCLVTILLSFMRGMLTWHTPQWNSLVVPIAFNTHSDALLQTVYTLQILRSAMTGVAIGTPIFKTCVYMWCKIN